MPAGILTAERAVHIGEAFLDIETTGLSPRSHYITVIGVYSVHDEKERLVQLVAPRISTTSLTEALRGITTIYTYNGSRFDVPFIHTSLGLNLDRYFRHCDLMFDCWKNNLFGGQKSVERQLHIKRNLTGMDGRDAVTLWWKYYNRYDQDALKTLLEYNREDLVNLKRLRDVIIG